MEIHIPTALVLGTNTLHGIGVLSDWIEEQTGFPLDFFDSSWNGDIYAANIHSNKNLNNNDSDGYGNGCNYGSNIGYGNWYGHGDGTGRGYGTYLGNGYSYIDSDSWY